MPHRFRFSADEDATIRRMRCSGETWDAVTTAIGHSCKVVIRDHAYRCNLVPRSARQPARNGAAVVAEAHARPQYMPAFSRGYDIMPAFHPTSWNAIWAGLASRP